MENKKVKWQQSSEDTFVGYVGDKPVFFLGRLNKDTWRVFVSFRGVVYDTEANCKKWCEYDDQMKLAEMIVSMSP